MDESDPWREYRKRRNVSLLSFLGFPPFVVAFSLVAERLFRTPMPVFVFAFGWIILAVIAGNWFIRFPCPRCGNPFFADSKWWGYNTFTRRCLHCKLPLNASNVSLNGLSISGDE
jgi:hypothetical protein